MALIKSYAFAAGASTAFAAIAGTLAGFTPDHGSALWWLMSLYLSIARSAVEALSSNGQVSFYLLLVLAFHLWLLVFGTVHATLAGSERV
jgi:hypothetical protein